MRMPSSRSSATRILPSSIPNRLRNLAGTTMAPRLPTFADSIEISLPQNVRLHNLPDFQTRRLASIGPAAKLKTHMSLSAKPKAVLLVNIGQLLTLRASTREPGPRRGSQLGELGLFE